MVYDDLEFQLKYPTVDHVVEMVKHIGSTAKLMKVDLKRAYRNLRSDPFDFDLLGLTWDNQYYVDISSVGNRSAMAGSINRF